MAEKGSFNLDERAVRRIMGEEARKALKPLVDENRRLNRVLGVAGQKIIKLEDDNQRLTEGIGLAIELIESLKARPKNVPSDIFGYLGVEPQQVREDGESTNVVKALRRVALLIHPDVHPDEPELVKRALGFVLIPVNAALDRFKNKQ